MAEHDTASLADAGMSTRAIAAATGVSQPTVSRDLAGDSYESPDPDDDITDAEIIEERRRARADGSGLVRRDGRGEIDDAGVVLPHRVIGGWSHDRSQALVELDHRPVIDVHYRGDQPRSFLTSPAHKGSLETTSETVALTSETHRDKVADPETGPVGRYRPSGYTLEVVAVEYADRTDASRLEHVWK